MTDVGKWRQEMGEEREGPAMERGEREERGRREELVTDGGERQREWVKE